MQTGLGKLSSIQVKLNLKNKLPTSKSHDFDSISILDLSLSIAPLQVGTCTRSNVIKYIGFAMHII